MHNAIYTAPYELTKAHACDAGYDLYAHNREENEPIVIFPGGITRVKTGVRVMIPAGYAGIIKERSGFPYRGINIAVRGGVIDCGYTGEIVVLLSNSGNSIITLDGNKAVAQMVIVAIHSGGAEQVDSDRFERMVATLDKQGAGYGVSRRQSSGFGSSDQVAA